MRRHLLTLLALLVLLMQPAALLHALSHGPGGAHATASAGVHAAATADAGDPHADATIDIMLALAQQYFGGTSGWRMAVIPQGQELATTSAMTTVTGR